MVFLRIIFAATLVAVFFGVAVAGESAERQYLAIARLSAQQVDPPIVRIVEVDIDLAAGSLEIAEKDGRLDVLYRMAFNQIAEGWSWQPLADPAVDDYYRFKYLPLQSVAIERGEYASEDRIGTPQQMKISWRYDYFLAFDNLYDFYPRTVDDDAGFSANLPAGLAGHLGLRARARLVAPVISESTTFWKATHARPTDFTLKKRYLIGQLEEIAFVDTVSGDVVCRIGPGQAHCAGR